MKKLKNCTNNIPDPRFMEKALEEARAAFNDDEVPVGAVIVKSGKIISAARNSSRRDRNPLKHAELKAIEGAAVYLDSERLSGCEMYVTKEPCAMCAGAIVHARIECVFIGAADFKYGACGTVLSVCGNSLLNHRPGICFGIMEDCSLALLKSFFAAKRSGGLRTEKCQ